MGVMRRKAVMVDVLYTPLFCGVACLRQREQQREEQREQ